MHHYLGRGMKKIRGIVNLKIQIIITAKFSLPPLNLISSSLTIPKREEERKLIYPQCQMTIVKV
jgi:hypothetical protein